MLETDLTADEILYVNDDAEYEFVDDPETIRLCLEIADSTKLMDIVGHLIVESSDGHPYGIWYSTDPKPSDECLYNQIL
jgi:hypothetical protein